MSDNSQLTDIKFIPPETPWSARKAGIYPKFEYFAKIVSEHISDAQIAGELAVIREKLQS